METLHSVSAVRDTLNPVECNLMEQHYSVSYHTLHIQDPFERHIVSVCVCVFRLTGENDEFYMIS